MAADIQQATGVEAELIQGDDGIFDVVDIVADLGAEVEALIVPGEVVAGREVDGEMSFFAVRGEAVASAAVPESRIGA